VIKLLINEAGANPRITLENQTASDVLKGWLLTSKHDLNSLPQNAREALHLLHPGVASLQEMALRAGARAVQAGKAQRDYEALPPVIKYEVDEMMK